MSTTNEKNSIGTKVRSDSKLNGLPREQQALVDQWLFVENLGYDAVAALCKREFGLDLTVPSVRRYHQRERPRWELEEKAAKQMEKDRGAASELDGEALYQELLGKMIQVALSTAKSAKTAPDRRVVADYAKVLISARRESHEALRAATTREKFEFDAATACLIHQVKVQAIVEDEALNDGERIQKIREQLFGPDLPEAENGPDRTGTPAKSKDDKCN